MLTQIDQINAMIDAKRAEIAAAQMLLHRLDIELEGLQKLRHGVHHQAKTAGERPARVKTGIGAR
jgi:hypothetical protein